MDEEKKDERIKLAMEMNYNNRPYKELVALVPKRLLILAIKALSIKVLIPVPLATWALSKGYINGWIFFLVLVFTFSVRSFEKMIDKGFLLK